MDCAEEYCLTFEASGEKILRGIDKKLVDLDEEIQRVNTKARAIITHPDVDNILTHPDEIYLLYPTAVPDPDPDELWRHDPDQEDKYRRQLNAVQVAELYHELKEEKKVLEAIHRNLKPSENYTLNTTQLMLFGL